LFVADVRYPLLYQINTRVMLTELSRTLKRPATLDDIPDAELDRLAQLGFDWIWLLSVWSTGDVGRQVSRTEPGWRKEFQETLPDLQEDDIAGSGFAITGYTVPRILGGDAALARLRDRMRRRGLKLMLDFVPNHTAIDHPWVESNPEFYIAGTEQDLRQAPQNYTRVRRAGGESIFAYGRDPYFAGWPDTLQLNYAEPALQNKLEAELVRISGQCDGLRCDMAMLVLPDVFQRTWQRRPELFWPRVTKKVRERHPQFKFMAEVYWDLEWELQQQGFDYAYDKRLYDRLHAQQARPVREHFWAGFDYQDKLARFLENHDEPRAAATFAQPIHEAAAVLTFLASGLRFFHQGQLEGRLKRISPHLVRGPAEPVNQEVVSFYTRLLAVLRRNTLRDGRWQSIGCAEAWPGNSSVEDFVACAWDGKVDKADRWLIAVNYAPHWSQCLVQIPWNDLGGRSIGFADALSPARYTRDGSELMQRGLFLDLPPWGYHCFHISAS